MPPPAPQAAPQPRNAAGRNEGTAVLPEVPGIVEASMTISPEADGRISLRVLIGVGGGPSSSCDLFELIISPADIDHALAGATTGDSPGTQIADEPPTFPCHIGLHRNAHTRCDAEHRPEPGR